MKKLVKIAIASALILPVMSYASMTKEEMLKFSSEQLNNTPESEIKLDSLSVKGDWYFGDQWVVEIKNKEYICYKPGFGGLWFMGKGCKRGTSII